MDNLVKGGSKNCTNGPLPPNVPLPPGRRINKYNITDTKSKQALFKSGGLYIITIRPLTGSTEGKLSLVD